MSAPPLKILVVDDEPPIRKLLRMGLSTQGYEILEAPNGTHLELIEYQQPDVAPPPRRSPAEPGSAVIPFAIEDSESVVEQLREAGIEILGGPVPYLLDGVSTKTTYVYDPDGNILCMFEVVSGTYTIGDKESSA